MSRNVLAAASQPCDVHYVTEFFFYCASPSFLQLILILERPDHSPSMSVGFGFSVGDFIAAIELVGTVINALQCSGSAAKEYRELISQLISLENALLQVKRLEFDESQYAEVIALKQAASQCQRTIDVFWKQAQKYQPHLACEGRSGTRSEIKAGWMKIKWAIFKREDVTRFKADLVGHTESIQVLLATFQMWVMLIKYCHLSWLMINR